MIIKSVIIKIWQTLRCYFGFHIWETTREDFEFGYSFLEVCSNCNHCKYELYEETTTPIKCLLCGKPKIDGCDGDGWMEPLGPYPDGSYMTMCPCLNANPYYETH